MIDGPRRSSDEYLKKDKINHRTRSPVELKSMLTLFMILS